MEKVKKIHFEISERKILLKLLDVFSILLFLYINAQLWQIEYFLSIFSSPTYLLVFIVYISFFCTLFEMYNLQIASNQQQIIKSIVFSGFAICIFYIITPIITPILPNKRYQIFLLLGIIFCSLICWRLLYLKIFTSVRFQKNVIFIGNKDQVNNLIYKLGKIDPHYKVRASIISNQFFVENELAFDKITVDEILNFIKKNNISEIVIADKENDLASQVITLLLESLERGVIVREFNEVYESITASIPIFDFDKKSFTYFPFGRSNTNKLYVLGIRIFDIILSLLGLLGLLCILPIIYCINLFANKGPLFYKQERVGQYGKPFNVHKLRSMVINAEKNGAQFAQKNDSRITPFGKFIRRSRLDEIPQFYNVLKGEMSIIGPRPERPIFVDKIAEIMPVYKARHVVKPGLTGWAQVKYSYGATIDDSIIKLQYDLYYIKNRSFALDINILIKTLNTVLFFKGQ
jgi:exopolysaccharide biosynthesis polyprenyl glycosylphosphotransferase